MPVLYILSGLSVAAALLSGLFNIKENPVKRLVYKLLGSVLFCAVGLGAMYARGSFSTYGIGVMSALILGLIGDLFLCMNGLAEPGKLMFFNAVGFFCFLLGHVLFVAIFLSVTTFHWQVLPVFLVVPLGLGLFMISGMLNAKKLNIALLGYSSFLGLMLMSAVNLYLNTKNIAGIFAVIAAVLFAVSDLSLALREFGKFINKKFLIFDIQVTYYIAQCLFALSIFFF
jgi:uncharacterized membrane protein YhhN